jgi:hypothetical protein
MALTLIKEDGTARVDANSYADATDGDAYHDGHLYAGTWTAATTSSKETALVMASRLIDSQVQFNGYRVNDRQGLQWPRWKCPDPDGGLALIPIRLLPRGMGYVDFDIVPKNVIDATCEMARELLTLDRTTAPPGEGIDTVQVRHSVANADGTTKISSSSTDMTRTKYSKGDTRRIISDVAQAMLVKYGSLVCGSSGMVRLWRA